MSRTDLTRTDLNDADLIHSVLDTHGKLTSPAASLAVDADLYAHGMTSHASVNVMLAVEDAFEIEFPDDLLTKETFSTIGAIADAVDSLTLIRKGS